MKGPGLLTSCRLRGRRRWLLAGALLLAGCVQVLSGPARAPVLVDPPRRPGKPVVLIAMPNLESFRTVRRALVDELRPDFNLVTRVIEDQTTAAEFAEELTSHAVACVILMNNPTVNLYRAYQRRLDAQATPVPAVVVMSSFLEELRTDLKNATGIAFEVPGVSAVISLRSVVARPVQRVGVIHRPAFRGFLKRQFALAEREEITLVAAPVPTDATLDDIQKAVRSLRNAQVEALWVLNDNRLLEDEQYRELMTELGVPVLVGVPALVPSAARFGTLAVIPDLDALGVQTANLVVSMSEGNWNARAHPIELPLSTLTLVNIPQMRQRFGLRPDGLQRIDRQVE